MTTDKMQKIENWDKSYLGLALIIMLVFTLILFHPSTKPILI
jgi:hypothetical protein